MNAKFSMSVYLELMGSGRGWQHSLDSRSSYQIRFKV